MAEMLTQERLDEIKQSDAIIKEFAKIYQSNNPHPDTGCAGTKADKRKQCHATAGALRTILRGFLYAARMTAYCIGGLVIGGVAFSVALRLLEWIGGT